VIYQSDLHAARVLYDISECRDRYLARPALVNHAQHVIKAKTVAIVDDSTAYGQKVAKNLKLQAKADGI